jgi:arylsulfatase A-like enzyme
MIFHALRHSGALENTVIIFASDNGLAVGQHGLMGKQNMFDHSLRVPLVITGPGIPTDRRQEQLIYLQDIVPTICDVAGVAAPEGLYFHSLLPILHDPNEKTKYPEVYAAYKDLQRMVRTKQHKLIFYPTVPKVLLYDLEKDPFETTDVSEDPAYCAVRRELVARLKEEQSKVGDTLTLSMPDTPCVVQQK